MSDWSADPDLSDDETGFGAASACAECDGGGEVECEACEGDGEDFLTGVPCVACHGSGVVHCWECS